jgi:DNA-binding transcriptional MocR family regulator
LNSPAYVSLSLPARSAFFEVLRGYNGANNGKIALSVRQLAERMNYSINTAMRALQELVEKGFVEPRIKGSFSVKFRHATEWRLTDRRCDATGARQSQAFLKWKPPPPAPAEEKSATPGQHVQPDLTDAKRSEEVQNIVLRFPPKQTKH